VTGTDLGAPSRSLRSPSYEAFFAYGAAFALTFIATNGLVLIVGAWRASGRPTLLAIETQGFARSAFGLMACALVEGVVLATIALVSDLGRDGRGARLRLGPSTATPGAMAGAVLGMIGLSAAGGATAELLHLRAAGVAEAIGHALESPPPMRLVLGLVCLGLVPALAEEMFFRGLLLPRLSRAWGPAPAIVVSAAAFGIFHLDRVQGAVGFVAGLLLGWVAERFGSVRPCIAAHATNNMLFVALAALAPSWESSLRIQTWVLVGGALACGASVIALASRAALRRQSG